MTIVHGQLYRRVENRGNESMGRGGPIGWQPIETAPKDGTRILTWTPGSIYTGWDRDKSLDYDV